MLWLDLTQLHSSKCEPIVSKILLHPNNQQKKKITNQVHSIFVRQMPYHWTQQFWFALGFASFSYRKNLMQPIWTQKQPIIHWNPQSANPINKLFTLLCNSAAFVDSKCWCELEGITTSSKQYSSSSHFIVQALNQVGSK